MPRPVRGNSGYGAPHEATAAPESTSRAQDANSTPPPRRSYVAPASGAAMTAEMPPPTSHAIYWPVARRLGGRTTPMMSTMPA